MNATPLKRIPLAVTAAVMLALAAPVAASAASWTNASWTNVKKPTASWTNRAPRSA